MKNKKIMLSNATEYFHDGMTIMVGGFMGVGSPPRLLQAVMDSGIKNITLICNDTAFIESGVGPLISHGRVKKVIASHIGTNPETGRRMISGELDVELIPQGTLAERIRCGGAGIGGFLTQTGVGTVVQDGKQIISRDGVDYVLEFPLRADLALIKADMADPLGNLTYKLSARNFNPLLAFAADTVIAEPNELVEIGDISPECVITPAALVDFIVYPLEA
ncbi:acetate CoA-transferase subunit alpha [Martelella alba]|uniref:Acetate CoA-transferase subunit alpha n=1 Tax=Martelella alba TaxID=2590451 RepID=A0ABY2SIJ4_9HYPH|nr:acetate CoA-transferase subunit alpha [Martelella alba]TKI05224.1 acetate CoA-transferase subunit alpha [Martelella alba]